MGHHFGISLVDVGELYEVWSRGLHAHRIFRTRVGAWRVPSLAAISPETGIGRSSASDAGMLHFDERAVTLICLLTRMVMAS
jgi:hypothetical protein